ncbi:biotin-dependent carboxyltransferase family protein [Nocardioides insulae]|uniref:5-oxoprolinase subunit C family protein n=1 Tax=Nocardioides insulae TaxID=394734 RepID=UPI0004275BDB|nr:biotin-dependent carboxyltransferase family protein [Nocardioides insulae]
MSALEIVETGPLTTVQDQGRPGQAALGVGISGAADRRSLRLANRLVGNAEEAAGLEVTFGGLVLRARGDLLVALTGAAAPVTVAGSPMATNSLVRVPDGAELRVGTPTAGVRSYLAVRGGVDVPPVLGSRSTDVMARLGPAVLEPEHTLAVGRPAHPLPDTDLAPVAPPTEGEIVLRVVPGPRHDWFVPEALEVLTGSVYQVTTDSDRVGMRLSGAELERARDDELPSEGMVPGALQVPPSGRPTLFLADHPMTGGYPVIAVVLDADLDLAAQARPGQGIRFVPASSTSSRRSGSDHR